MCSSIAFVFSAPFSLSLFRICAPEFCPARAICTAGELCSVSVLCLRKDSSLEHSTAVGQPHLWSWVEANTAHYRLSPFSGKLGSTLAAFPHRVYRQVFAVVIYSHAMPARCSRNYATLPYSTMGLDNLSRSSTMLKETWRRSPRCWALSLRRAATLGGLHMYPILLNILPSLFAERDDAQECARDAP